MPLRTNGPKREKQRIDIILKSGELINELEEKASNGYMMKGRTNEKEPDRTN